MYKAQDHTLGTTTLLTLNHNGPGRGRVRVHKMRRTDTFLVIGLVHHGGGNHDWLVLLNGMIPFLAGEYFIRAHLERIA